MTAIMERLDRWAENLPSTDPIPVGEGEVEVIAASVSLPKQLKRGEHYGTAVKRVSDEIKAGTFKYKLHKVVVL